MTLRRLSLCIARSVATFVALFAVVASSQSIPQQRPRITGISHVGYFVSDLPAALRFWHDLLGFDVAYDLKRPGSDDTRIAFVKINDHQHVELFAEPPTSPPNHMSHICFTVDNVEQMKAYLRKAGVEVKPGNAKTRAGDFAFEIVDPDGMLVEFVQSLPDGLEARAAGKFLPSTRIATSIYHAGFLVGNSQRSLDFYGRILGFKEVWRGGPDPKELAWINMQVPDGDDYVEFMLYRKLPANFGGKNHLSLLVPDVAKAIEVLRTRADAAGYKQPLDLRTGVNHKHQVNMYDPDGTRVELMESHTVDGKPVPPSTAPPPPAMHE